MSDRLVKVVIVVVTMVWAVNFLIPLWNPDYKPVPEVNAAFLTVVGALVVARVGNTKNEEPEEPPPPTPPSPPRTEEPSGVDPR